MPVNFMGGMNTYAGTRLGVAALLLAAVLTRAEAVTPTVVLPESTKPVDATPAAGAANPTRPFVSRQALTSAETSAPMTFEVVLKMRDFAGLQARISKGERIPAPEMAEKYEPSAADYQKVVDWLQGAGFTIVRQDSHHMVVFARGTVSQVASSLKVDFARVTSGGKDYTSAVTAPSVPSDISALLTGINGLQPHLRAHKHLLKPQGTNASTGSAQYLPSQIAQAYGSAGLNASGLLGGGQTIAIVIDTFPSTTDLLLFWQNCNVPQSISNIQFVDVVPGATLPSPSGEETLDVEWSSAMAPQAHVRVYAASDLGNTDLDLAYQQVYDDVTNHPELGIHQMSMSYGEGETYTTRTQVNTDDQYFAELSAAGVTCFASSGDGGATPGPSGGGDESGPVQVESPASDPNVVGVGGTSLMLDSNNNTSSEVVWNNSSGASGGGNSEYFTSVNGNAPTWQVGPGVPAPTPLSGGGTETFRYVPDICGPADPNYGAIVYFQGARTVYGGTSWASPVLAAFCAILNQVRADTGQSAENSFGPDLYPLLNSANYATYLRDIQSGTNSTRGLNNGYTAVPDPDTDPNGGYDRATGVGSPKMAGLASVPSGGNTPVGVQMPAPMVSVTPGQNATFTVSVGGTSATYQWQRMPIGSTTWSNLGDGGAYSGSASATLTVTAANSAMNGDRFQCLISLGNNVAVTSTPSVLVVDSPMVVSTLAGSVGTSALADGTGTAAHFAIPSGIAVDGSGNLFIADYSNNNIREVTPAGVTTTPYGSASGVAGLTDDSGNNARFKTPNGIAYDDSSGQGILYVADTGNNLIRKIVGGVVSTFAASVSFSLPEGVAVDGSGNVYVVDTGHNIVRKITAAGSASILAGRSGVVGYQDGAASSALFNAPSAIAVDGSGNVYVADFGNSVIRKISGGQVTTVAGTAHVAGYLDGPTGTALFNTPSGIAVDSAGNIYVADCLVPPLNTNATGNDLVRKISTTGAVSTLAGQAGNEGSADGTGTAASFYSVQAVAIDPASGTFYLADTYNQTIRAGTIVVPLTLSITATQPLAEVAGTVAGVFTVTRVGGDPSASVTATYTVGGTAVEGTDYTPALPGTLTIPVGETSVTIPITPVENDAASVNPTVQLSLSPGNYQLGNSSSATVTIQELTSFPAAMQATFGADAAIATIGGPTADPNHNGVPNLLEYAFGANPLQTGTEPLPVIKTILDANQQEHLAITYNQINSDSSLTYTVQVSSDLVNWISGSSATTVVSSQPVTGTNVTQVTVMDNTVASSAGKRFIRVQVGQN